MKRAIIGAGGFAREVYSYMKDPSIVFFVSNKYHTEENSKILPLSSFDPFEYEVIIAIANPLHRQNIKEQLPKYTTFFNYVHPTAQIIDPHNIRIGEGTIICPNTIITTNVFLGSHSHLNIGTVIGHDCTLGNYFTTAPGAKISGNCTIGNRAYVGTNASIKEKTHIVSDVTIGLNAGVVKNIEEPGTYVGTPVKKIK